MVAAMGSDTSDTRSRKLTAPVAVAEDRARQFDWWSLKLSGYGDRWVLRVTEFRRGRLFWRQLAEGPCDYDPLANDYTRPNAEDFKAARRKLEELEGR